MGAVPDMPLTPSEISLLQGAVNGFKRMVASSGVQKAVVALITAYFAIKAASPDLTPTFRGVLWTGFVTALFGLARECIAATAKEDAAAKTPAPVTIVSAPVAATPPMQVNVGPGNVQDNQPPDASPPAVPADVKPKPPAPPTATWQVTTTLPDGTSTVGLLRPGDPTSPLPTAVTKVLGPVGELPPALGTTTSGAAPASTARSGAAPAPKPARVFLPGDQS